MIFATANFCSAKDFVVVIDPGHGGKDFGAIGKNSYEKNINLGVALKLGDLIEKNCKNVKIVYTRNTDRFLSLQQRANVANKAEGDLFISIHTNSVSKKAKNRKTINGSATYTLGLHKTDENLEVAKRENAVIELEPDHTEAYRGFDPNSSESYIIFEISQSQHVDQSINFASLVQQELAKTANRKNNGVRQAGFWVLAATSMPAVLVELDFICNPTQEKFLSSKKGQEKLAKAIFNAFKSYKNQTDNKIANINKTHGKESSNTDEVVAHEEKNSKIDKFEVNHSDNHGSNRSLRSQEATSEQNISNSSSLSVTDRESLKSEATKQESQNTIIYKVQFLTSGKKLRTKHPEFKKLTPVDFYYDNGLYKYTYGETTSLSEANSILDAVKNKFKDAFIIKFKNGKRIK